jgi:SAM-dependent methyltransferase
VRYFTSVVATDASAAQIASAGNQAGIEFRVAPAEVSRLLPESVDLITVAQALHWFKIDAFFDEARRVLRPAGVLAIWCYGHCNVEPGCDELIKEVFAEVEQYWPPERDIVEARYAGIRLPFTEIPSKDFDMQASWTADDMLDYMRTWSASQRYIGDIGADPTVNYADPLRAMWGGDRRTVLWPITLRLGRR